MSDSGRRLLHRLRGGGHRRARTALDQGCVQPYNTFKPWGEVGLLVPRAGRYVVVQTTTPYGYATPAEQWIAVIATGPHAGTQWVMFYPPRA